MKTTFKFCLSILITSAVLVSCVTAQGDTDRQFRRDSGTLVNSALQYANTGHIEEALGKLDEAFRLSNLNPYEKSTIYQMMGQYNYELDRLDASMTAFENAIDAGGLLPSEKNKIEVVIAQILVGKGQYRDGAERLETYLNSGGTQQPQYMDLLVSAWFQAEDYERALPWAKRWHEEANPKERKQFDLLNYLYSQLKLHDEQLKNIDDMIKRWPNDQLLWLEKASVLSNSGQEKEAYYVHAEMYERGLFKKKGEIRNLLYYHDYYGDILSAALLLENELKSGILEEDVDSLVLLSIYNRDLAKTILSQSAFNKAIEISDEQRATHIKQNYELNKSKYGGYLKKPRFRHLENSVGYLPVFNAGHGNRKQGNFKITVSDPDAQPLVRIPAQTPESATQPGHCRVRFDVSPNGQPFNIETLSCSEYLFSESAIHAVSRWKYNPKVVDGQIMPRSGVETKISFKVK